MLDFSDFRCKCMNFFPKFVFLTINFSICFQMDSLLPCYIHKRDPLAGKAELKYVNCS